jgi:hypothetical protein
MGDPCLYCKITLSQCKEQSHKRGIGCLGTPCISDVKLYNLGLGKSLDNYVIPNPVC